MKSIYLTKFNNFKTQKLDTNTVLNLMNFYGLTDPATSIAGQYSNTDLQQLYDALILQGSSSDTSALMTGALIEEVDILDLEEEMVATTNVNLLGVYNNLLEGSKRHLVAFVKTLELYGITYTPQEFDIQTYQDILATTIVGGNGGGFGQAGTGTGTGTGNTNIGNNGTGNGTGTGNGNTGNGNGNGGGFGNSGNGNGGN